MTWSTCLTKSFFNPSATGPPRHPPAAGGGDSFLPPFSSSQYLRNGKAYRSTKLRVHTHIPGYKVDDSLVKWRHSDVKSHMICPHDQFVESIVSLHTQSGWTTFRIILHRHVPWRKIKVQDPQGPASSIQFRILGSQGPTSSIHFRILGSQGPMSSTHFRILGFQGPTSSIPFRIQGSQGPTSGIHSRFLGSQGPMTSINFRIQSPQGPTT